MSKKTYSKLGLIHFCFLLLIGVGFHLWLYNGPLQDSDRLPRILPATIGYCLFLFVISSVLISVRRNDQENFSKWSIIKTAWKPILEWHGWVLFFELIGAVVGSVSYVTIGWLFQIGENFQTRFYNGLLDGIFYFLIWGPGASVVIVIIRSVKRNSNPNDANEFSERKF